MKTPIKTNIALAFEGFPKINTPIDEIEIHGCKDIDGRGTIEQCPDEEAEFFTLYVHYKGGGLDAIFDCTNLRTASETRELLLLLIKNYQ